MSDITEYLQGVLHRDIPITREMGVGVISWDQHRLQLSLPLAPNVNHKHTLFGGSLYCGAVLAGWGWLYLRLREAGIDDGHIVVHEGLARYPQPVTGDARVICEPPEDSAWTRFMAVYERRGRARLALQTQVMNPGSEEAAVLFAGQFVVHR